MPESQKASPRLARHLVPAVTASLSVHGLPAYKERTVTAVDGQIRDEADGST